MKKQFIALLCSIALTLSACGASTSNNVSQSTQQKEETTEQNETTDQKETTDEKENTKETDFESFINQLFVEELESDYMTFHTYVENADDYGINRKNVEVTLGDFSAETEEEESEEERDQENYETLKSFDYDSLTDEQKDIYDQLIYTYELNDKASDEKYNYLGNIWSSTSNSATELYNYFVDYVFYSEQDIKDCITLINDMPRYCGQIVDYTKEQANEGLLMIDYDTVVESIQDIIDAKDKNNVLNALVKSMDTLKLDDSTKKDYEEQIKEALDESFYPSFETMKKGLEAVKDKVVDHTGLKNMDNGSDYYKILLQSYTGTDDNPKTIREKLETIIDDAMTVIYENYSEEDTTTDFNSIDEIMSFLEKNYTSEFPKIDIPDYNVEALSTEQEEDNIVAYYLIPALDSTSTQKIRYNSHNSDCKANSLSFYQTLAHEGIPGHMYTREYFKEHLTYNISFLLSNLGLSEGYATYVESRALHFLDLDESTLKYENAYSILNNAYTCLMDLSVNYDGLSYDEFVDEYGDLFGTDLEDIYNILCESPGLFMAYYYGFFTILDLRQEAVQEMGDSFDNVKFNATLLQSGEVNFDIVKRNVENYIATAEKEK